MRWPPRVDLDHAERPFSRVRLTGKARHMSDALSVLVVEDEPLIAMMIEDLIDLLGHRLAGTADAVAEALPLVEQGGFDVAILDVNLPDTSGFELARDAAEEGHMGVVILTARAGRDDRVKGYGVGADLYLTKPVDGEELLLAVRNLTRRARTASAGPSPAAQAASPPADFAWKLDATRQALLLPHGARLALSGREMLLVEALARADGATVSRQKLASELGYADASSESRSLDAVVRRLRQKAQDAGAELPLKAVHAVGFRFAARLKLL